VLGRVIKQLTRTLERELLLLDLNDQEEKEFASYLRKLASTRPRVWVFVLVDRPVIIGKV
jgi:hypothetical protein